MALPSRLQGLQIDWSKRGDKSLSYCVSKLDRRLADHRMARFRSVPRRRHAQFVRLTAIPIPAGVGLKTLPHDTYSCWIRSRRLAKELVERDRARGGQGWTDTYEYRRCLVCKRLLIGREASDYRERCRWPEKTWQYPQGPVCGWECVPVKK